MSQGERYLELAARAGAGTRTLDSSYKAAFYLLSYDSELAQIAAKYISYDGIDFTAIKRQTKGFDETSRQVVDIAHNLFSWNSKCKVTPFDISRLGYPYMEKVCDAVFIASEQYEIALEVSEESEVLLALDTKKYEQTKQIHRKMDRIYAQMMESQDTADMEMER